MRAREAKIPRSMGELVRVIKWGKGLGVLVPAALAREIRLRRRDYVLWRRGQGRTLILIPQRVNIETTGADTAP
jgi:antitoxin component of MazEF toxin-antitoxin module